MPVQWSEVVARPKGKVLRQFAGLWLLFFVAIAAWRSWHGEAGARTGVLAALGLLVGGFGLWRPAAVRWVYTGCMIATFPIAFVVSHVVLAVIFYGVFTPVAVLFRAVGRDPLNRRPGPKASYWTAKSRARDPSDYLRQS